MKLRAAWPVVAGVALAALSACGGEDDSLPATTGTGGTAGDGGVGASGGAGGAPGGGGVGGNPIPETARAFPGAEGFAAQTSHGRGGVVCVVTNTDDAGAGSLRDCLMMTEPRIVIFRTSGTIYLQNRIALGAEHSHVAVLGETSPGGIAIAGPDDGSLTLSHYKSGDPPGAFHDGLFRHLRFRHGSLATNPSGNVGNHDNVTVFGGTHDVVFDHNSFTWTGDELISFWASGDENQIHDITFSHNLFAEAQQPSHNLGPLLSGGSSVGAAIYNVTFHNNLGMHVSYRNFKLDTGSGADDRGVQFINNIHYNSSSQDYNFGQNQYSGCSSTRADIINDLFKAGPAHPPGRRPVTISRIYTATSDPAHLPPGGCDFDEVSLHFVGSRKVLQDGSPAPDNDEADNYAMVATQYGGETWTSRSTPIATQPLISVTVQSADAAYTNVVVNQNVGATKPVRDPVDQRLVEDPEDGGDYSTANVPSAANYPTLSGSAPTDSDGDGVPDAFETATLGTDPHVFENHAALDHDADGYTNVEEWAASL